MKCETRTLNEYNQDMMYELSNGKVIAGLRSIHLNGKEYVFLHLFYHDYFIPICNTEQNNKGGEDSEGLNFVGEEGGGGGGRIDDAHQLSGTKKLFMYLNFYFS